MNNFNTRPNPIDLKQAQIDDLTVQLGHTFAQLYNAQSELKKRIDQDAVDEPSHTEEELKDQLECAQMNASDHHSILCGMQSPYIFDAFKAEGKIELYKKFIKIQETNILVANAHVASLTLCLFQIATQGKEEERADLINCAVAEIEEGPIENWRCNRYIDQILMA